jgi:hypothetical protein
MSVETFIPEIWAGELLVRLKAALVFKNIANEDYSGDIQSYGDVVKINQIGTINISTYTKNSTTLTRQKLSSAQKELKINQAKYFDFDIDDIDMAQTKPKVMQEAMQESAWGLANAADQYIAALYTDAGIVASLGTEATAIDITSVNVIEYLGLVAQKLDEANVPFESRWMMIPPWFHQKIVLAKITLDTNNSEVFNNGFVGSAMGFNFFMSNNVSVKTAATNQGSRIMAGYRGTITFAEQISKVEAFRPHDGFEDAVKGLYLYGAKVTRPDTLAVNNKAQHSSNIMSETSQIRGNLNFKKYGNPELSFQAAA